MKKIYRGSLKKLRNTVSDKYAIIDLGSNTIRLSIYSFENNTINVVFSQKEIGGLAGMVSGAVLTERGINKACEILVQLKQTALIYTSLANIHLFATASLRNISNQAEVVERIISNTSLTPNILPGEEEALLTFIGTSQYLPCKNGLILDIGGGSTELVLVKNSEVSATISMPIGCLNLYANYVGNVLPSAIERKQIKDAIKEQLSLLGRNKWGAEPISLIIGAGGTMRALAKLSHYLYGTSPDQKSIEAKHVKDIYRRLKKDTQIYHAIYDIIPERIITIIPGLMITREIIKRFNCEKVMISKFGVREGYLMDRVIGRNSDERNKNDTTEMHAKS